MAGEIVASSKSSQSSNPFGSISILVVDDDTTCLSIVAAILKSWKYEVVTVKHPMDALCTLRIKGGSFDLVVTDVHMPDMDGFELQKQIDEEFKLPVVFMSADDKDGIILKGLQSGAAFFIVKPIAPDDLKNLWQYAVAKKKGKTIIEEIGSVEEISQADIDCNEDTSIKETSQTDKASNEDLESASSANEDRQSTKEFKRKAPANDTIADNGENKDDSATPKKAKVIWTNALHNQFLEAIRSIGLERAVPKKILELMNVPGLTRENVASHLQKYRIFLKRVSEASYKIQSAAERNMVERTFRSTFASSGGGQASSLMYNNNRSRLGLRNEGYVPVVEAPPNLGNPCSFSSTNSTPRFGGSAQSLLLCNQGNLKQPTIGNGSTKPLYQAKANPSSGLKLMEPNNHRTRSLSLHGNASGGLMTSGANLFQMYQQKAQEVAPKSFNTNGLLKYNSTTCGVRSPKDISNTGYGKMGAFNINSSNLNNLKPNSYNNNYAGYRVAGDGRLVGLGYIGFMGAEAPTDFNSNNFWINGKQNGSMPVLSGNSGDHLAQHGMITSTGFGFHSENHISPTFINAIQQESTSVPSLPPTPPLQQNGFGNGGESEDIFGLFNNVSDSASDSFLQPYDEGDLSFTFLNQINIQSPTQQDREQAMSSGYSFNSYLVEDNQLVNKQTFGEQPGGEVMVSNFGIDGSQSKKYFPSFDENHSQQDDEEFLESVFGSGEYDWDNNIGGL